MNRKKISLIDTIPPKINVRRDPLNSSNEFRGPRGHILAVMPVQVHFQLPKNNWKDMYGPC